MATAWELLFAGSTLSSGTAWEHLNNLGGGGDPVYIDRWHMETPIEVEVDELEVAVQTDDVGIAVAILDLGIAVEIPPEPIDVETEDFDVAVDLSHVAPVDWDWTIPFDLVCDIGSIGSGQLSDVYADDGNILVIDELVGKSPAFSATFRFVSLPDCARTVHLLGCYDGNPAHNVKLQVYDSNAELWVNFTADVEDFPATATEQTYQFAVPLPCAEYVSNGEMLVKVVHVSNGSTGHTMNINRLYLS